MAAHCYGDFLLQTDHIARAKRKTACLLLHAAIHAALVYLVLQQWTWWALPLSVFLVHGLIDFVKCRSGKGPKAFAIDQGTHLLSLWVLASIAAAMNSPESSMGMTVHFRDWILPVAAKSILRFEEAKKQPLAEYVLIGTLWSFSLAIALAYFTFYLLT